MLSRLSSLTEAQAALFIVSYPEAVAEMVVTRKSLDQRTLSLQQGQTTDVEGVLQTLRDFGFREVDYVYEPGQFAQRGSIVDVFSFSSEYPFRIDFFGDDIDSIRTFEVENQLSRERRTSIDIVPELSAVEDKETFLSFLPADALLVFRDYQFVCDTVERIWQEGFSAQALTERLEGATEVEEQEIRREMQRDSRICTGAQFVADSGPKRMILLGSEGQRSRLSALALHFNTAPQPLLHKNFELLAQTFADYREKAYAIYVLADSQKQNERLKEILASDELKAHQADFIAVDKTLHAGFVDKDLRLCLFTDHQIFDRFHKYNLKSDKARSGKMALTLKEIQQFEVGDYVVHVDHGIGKFGGLVWMPIAGNTPGAPQYQEMIKIIYQRGDAIYVSIHSLYKVAKYKAQDGGQAPRLSTLGTGQ